MTTTTGHGGSREGAGRKRRPESQRRTQQIGLRLTSREMAVANAIARRQKKTATTWVRERVLAALESVTDV